MVLLLQYMLGYIWITLGGVTLTIGDIIFKIWIDRSLPYLSLFYTSGMVCYIVGLIFLVESFKTQNIAVASALFVIMNIVTLALFSWFYFHEPLSTTQMFGLGLALIAIFLLEVGS